MADGHATARRKINNNGNRTATRATAPPSLLWMEALAASGSFRATPCGGHDQAVDDILLTLAPVLLEEVCLPEARPLVVWTADGPLAERLKQLLTGVHERFHAVGSTAGAERGGATPHAPSSFIVVDVRHDPLPKSDTAADPNVVMAYTLRTLRQRTRASEAGLDQT